MTLLYCEKPMLLNLICWLVKINEFYYSPSFIYIIFSATKLQIDENHGILWENYIVQVCKVKNWRYILFVFFKKQIRHPWKKNSWRKKNHTCFWYFKYMWPLFDHLYLMNVLQKTIVFIAAATVNCKNSFFSKDL